MSIYWLHAAAIELRKVEESEGHALQNVLKYT